MNSHVSQDFKDFKDFKVNNRGALNSIARTYYTPEDYFFEIFGALVVEAKSFIRLWERKTMLIFSGDDNGFSKEDYDIFAETHISQGRGLGSHGQGCRAAVNYFLVENSKENEYSPAAESLEYFCIISKCKDEKHKTIYFNVNPDYADDLKTNYFQLQHVGPTDSTIDEINFYNRHLLGADSGTVFCLPNTLPDKIGENSIKKINKKNKENIRTQIVNRLNLHISNRIVNNFTFHQNLCEQNNIKYPLITSYVKHSYKSVNITCRSGKLKGNGQSSCGIKHYFIFDKKIFNMKKNIVRRFPKTKTEVVRTEFYDEAEIDFKDDIVFSLTMSYCNLANEEDVQNHHKESYSIDNLSHQTGLYLSKKNIILNFKSIGTPQRGNTDKNNKPIFLFSDMSDNVYRSEANKSRLTIRSLAAAAGNLWSFLIERNNKWLNEKHEKHETSAVIIQRYFRDWRSRRRMAKATIIQCYFRDWRSRRRMAKATIIQCYFRDWRSRRRMAKATIIQCYFRCGGRRMAKVTILRYFRDWRSRRRMAKATIIQCYFRDCRSRRRMAKATIIQRYFRDWRSRIRPANAQHTQNTRSAAPGGWLYILYLKGSKDQITDDGRIIYNFGYSESGNLKTRIKKHGGPHPRNKVEVVNLWKVDFNVYSREQELLEKMQRANLIFNAVNTTTSEFVTDLDKVEKLVSENLPNCDTKIPCHQIINYI